MADRLRPARPAAAGPLRRRHVCLALLLGLAANWRRVATFSWLAGYELQLKRLGG
jgi:hypothetical protein